MRALSREPQEYILSTEWDRLDPSSKEGKPTRFFIRVQTGEEMMRWGSLREQIDNDKRLDAEEKALAVVRLDQDLIARAVVRIEDWETGGEPPLETTSDQARIRAIISTMGKLEREELGAACVLQGRLSLGEPSSLRQRLTPFFGAQPSLAASEITSANAAPGSEDGSIADA